LTISSNTIKTLALLCCTAGLGACQNLLPQNTDEIASHEPHSCDCPTIAPKQEPIVITKACPVVKTTKVASNKKDTTRIINDLLLIGRVENVTLLPANARLKARIDTGAGLTSLHAENLVFFERDSSSWVRFSVTGRDSDQATVIEKPIKRYINIKQHSGGSQRRPIVELNLKLGPLEEPTDISLTDRGGYLYPLLIGRNFLRDRTIVDVSTKFTIKSHHH
jgi:hypothetical protein